MGSVDGATKGRFHHRQRAQQRKTQRAAELGPVRVLMTGIDTLHVHMRRPVRLQVATDLEEYKQLSRLGRSPREWATITLGGDEWVVSPGNGKFGPFLLQAEHATLTVNPRPALSSMPTAILELRALWLWTRNLDQITAYVARVWGELSAPHGVLQLSGQQAAYDLNELPISRLDLTVDFQGWVPAEDEGRRAVARATRKAAYWEGRHHTGWMWGGGGPIAGRLYDKTREIDGTDRSRWLPKLWAQRGGAVYTRGAPVWRLELQHRREALLEFRAPSDRELLDVAVIADLLTLPSHLDGAWKYLTQSWVCLREPRRKNTRQEVDPRWAALQHARFGSAEAADRPALYRAQREAARDRVTASLAGYVATQAALEAQINEYHQRLIEHDVEMTDAEVELLAQQGLQRALKHLDSRGLGLAERVRERHRAMERSRQQLIADPRYPGSVAHPSAGFNR